MHTAQKGQRGRAMSKAANIQEAKAIAAMALLRDRTGFLAPSVTDEAREQAAHDAAVAIDAALRSGLLAGVPNERVIAGSMDQCLEALDADKVVEGLTEPRALSTIEALALRGWYDERRQRDG